MKIPDEIIEAVNMLEDDETYGDAGIASIHSTFEKLVLAKIPLASLRKQPKLSTQILLSRLKSLPFRSPDYNRIGLFVTLGYISHPLALNPLCDYLLKLPDETIFQVQEIGCPFRYALSAIELITGISIGLGPGENLELLFEKRNEIVDRAFKLLKNKTQK